MANYPLKSTAAVTINISHNYLLDEWDFEKNNVLGIFPEKVTYGSRKKVWWVCEKKHRWVAEVRNRTTNFSGCPYCTGNAVGYGNDLLTNEPELCKEWDYNRNKLGPDKYTLRSGKSVWWVCKSGHSWKAEIKSRSTLGVGCPYCCNLKAGYGNDLLINCPELAKEWLYTKNSKGPENYVPKSGKAVWWACLGCGYEWRCRIIKRVMRGDGCPRCSGKCVSKISQKWLDSLGVENREVKLDIKYCNKKYVVVDGFDPETNTVYEFFGDFWHGNPDRFSQDTFISKSKNITCGDKYKDTMERIQAIQRAGYSILYVWEADVVDELGGYL